MCTFEPEKPEASVDRGARELPLSPGHDPSKTSSFFACNKRYVKCIKREKSRKVSHQVSRDIKKYIEAADYWKRFTTHTNRIGLGKVT